MNTFIEPRACSFLVKDEYIDKFPSIFHYTINSYGGDIESNVPCGANKGFEQLSEMYGKDKVIWRYDPIFLTDLYTKLWHVANFKLMAYYLSKYTNRVVINFISLYEKVKRHMPELKEMTYSDKLYIINVKYILRKFED